MSGFGVLVRGSLKPSQLNHIMQARGCSNLSSNALVLASLRRDLALAHRLTAHFGMDELNWNHISCRIPPPAHQQAQQKQEHPKFLLTPGNKLFHKMRPEDLVINQHTLNETGDVIHGAIYTARSDVGAIMHTHTPSIVAVSCLKKGLMIVDQQGAMFHNMVAYHDWHGVSLDRSESEIIAKAVGPHCHTLILRNHGAVTLGDTISQAWVRMYYLDRVCRIQLQLMQLGVGDEAIAFPPSEVVAKAAATLHHVFTAGKDEWPALVQYAEEMKL
eukprot:c9333_g1_i1.p1 GENE.c9333_g1_i1~~c9333_g1_i1.p1  ORF type:complete len:292 (+),score=79.32 c9333_g1_i1:59-877(+)